MMLKTLIRDFKKKPSVFLSLAIIFFIASFFRFYKFAELFHYSLDEELWSYLIQRIIVFKDLPAVGGEISSTKIFTGPLFVYFHVPLFILSGLHPLIGGYFWGLIGIVTSIGLYFFGKKYFSHATGMLAAFFYAASFVMALYDRRFWNVSPIPLTSLLCAWFLLLALEKKRYYFIGLSLILSFALQSHFSAVSILLAVLVVFSKKAKSFLVRPSFFKKEGLAAMALFFLLNLGPLILFDLRHNFWHVKAVLNLPHYLTQPKPPGSNATFQGVSQNLSRSLGGLIYLGNNIDVAEEMSHCQALIDIRPKPPVWAQMFAVLILIAMLISSLKNHGKPLFRFILVLIIVNLLGLLIYRERVFTYHFAPLMPFFFLYFGQFGAYLIRKIRLVGITLIMAFFIFNLLSLLTAESKMGFANKEKTVQAIVNETGGQPIGVNFIPACEIWGFRYLFTVQQKPLSFSWADYVLGWLYPEELNEECETKVTVFVADVGRDDTFDQNWNETVKKAQKSLAIGQVTIFFEPAQRDSNNNFY